MQSLFSHIISRLVIKAQILAAHKVVEMITRNQFQLATMVIAHGVC